MAKHKELKDLENDIMGCWGVVDDMKIFSQRFADLDRPMNEKDIINLLNGLSVLYEVKFQKLWETFNDFRD